MNVVGFIGPSGTGKSYRALAIAYEHQLDCLIDDGILVYQNRIVAGSTAKSANNHMQAVRKAIFMDLQQQKDVCLALKRINPAGILILGTSVHMIERICQNLSLPMANSFISITDVASAEEIKMAQKNRMEEGTHIIPVPVFELRPHFSGYIFNPLRSWWYGRNGKEAMDRSVVRPVFSYYGKLIFANNVLSTLVQHGIAPIDGIAKVHRIYVEKWRKNKYKGVRVQLKITIYCDVVIKKLMAQIKRTIQQEIEYMTGMVLSALEIVIQCQIERV